MKLRDIPDNEAFRLYEKLRPFLRKVDSWGCYSPKRGENKAGDHSAWPLIYWKGPGTFPLIFEWNPKSKERQPTFNEFCLVYKLNPIVQ